MARTSRALDVTVLDPCGEKVVEREFASENVGDTFADASDGTWRMEIHSHTDYDGNGMAYLECLDAA